jgi:hypothetical protein
VKPEQALLSAAERRKKNGGLRGGFDKGRGFRLAGQAVRNKIMRLAAARKCPYNKVT